LGSTCHETAGAPRPGRHSCGPPWGGRGVGRHRPAGRKESTTWVTRTRAAPDGPADAYYALSL